MVRCQVCMLTYSISDWITCYIHPKTETHISCTDIKTSYIIALCNTIAHLPIRFRISKQADLASHQKRRSSADLAKQACLPTDRETLFSNTDDRIIKYLYQTLNDLYDTVRAAVNLSTNCLNCQKNYM